MESISKHVESVVVSSLVPHLVANLVKEFDLDEDRVTECMLQYVAEWTGGKVKPTKRVSAEKPVAPKVAPTKFDYNIAGLEVLKVADLKILCKQYGLALTGNKATLVERLTSAALSKTETKKTEFTSPDSDPETPVKPPSKSKATPKSRKRIVDSEDEEEEKPKKRMVKQPIVVAKIVENLEPIKIEEDEFGNRVNFETGFVFNEQDQAIGYLDDDGTVLILTDKKLEECKRLGIGYNVPLIMSEDEE